MFLLISLILALTTICEASDVYCDIIVAGGTTAALSAATNAARAAPEMGVCLTEPSDWLGGQLTAAGVSAIDYGPCNSNRYYHPPDWRAMVDSLGLGNPGQCWVSVKCFRPRILVYGWIRDAQENLTNLHVFYNTVIKYVSVEDREVLSVTGVTRTPRNGVDQWNYYLSEVIQDWYSTNNSSLFIKEVLEFKGRNGSTLVVLDTTQFGDILVLANASYRQGIEVPNEESLTTLDTCGQAITYPFYMVHNYEVVDEDEHLVNLTDDDFSLNNFTWGEVWSYRRSVGFTHGDPDVAKLGEVSNQNWGTNGGNDYLEGHVLLPYELTSAQCPDWEGGVNLTTLSEAERRSREYYTWYKTNAPYSTGEFLSMGPRSVIGTDTGLSMVPYLRDTRRSIGLDGFRLTKSDMSRGTLVKFHDRVSLGHYLYADTHPLSSCQAPDYLEDNAIEPYYIPFRALTNQDFDNVLVAGLTMAQTYFANAGTRLHPEEWFTGLAAGLAAVMMSRTGNGTSLMYENVHLLRDQINQLMPLDWENTSLCSRV